MDKKIEVIALCDFEGYFTNVVKNRIDKINVEKCHTILVTAGPYRNYAFALHYVEEGVCHIDFYSGLRMGFGKCQYDDMIDWCNTHEFDRNLTDTIPGSDYVWEWMMNRKVEVPYSAFIGLMFANKSTVELVNGEEVHHEVILKCQNSDYSAYLTGTDNWLNPSKLQGGLINKHLHKSEEESEWSLLGQNYNPEYNIITVEFKG